ncbi:MAG: DUF3109 family protein [Ignavibacteria bacterium]|nr:MAG: DUF3109 family protein [Ignavibacteria bacterium]
MFLIGEAVVEEEIAHERFSCDLIRCKGACCTIRGGQGAPLEDGELVEIHKALPAARKYLSEENLQRIEARGFFEGEPGSYFTTCVDDRDCVFVYYEDGIARCSLERAYQTGETGWRKPLSCHLFPLRVSHGPGQQIRYERISECSAGRSRGRSDDMPLYEFLKDALIRNFGAGWYEEFRRECLRRDAASHCPPEGDRTGSSPC